MHKTKPVVSGLGRIVFLLTPVLFLSPAAAAAPTADVVYQNGKIYTVSESMPWAQAVAIKDGKYLKVGTNDEVKKFIGQQTQLHDLGGKFVMPGIHDVHIHPAYQYTYAIDGQLDFPAVSTLAEIATALKAHANAHPEQTWIRGKQWGHALFANGKMPKTFIDGVVPDRPVVMVAESGHNVSVNSRALALAGITRETPNPEGGVIDKDANGEPTGYLSEEAIALVGKFVPLPRDDSYYQGLSKALPQLTAVGVTSIVDAKTGRGNLLALRRLEDEGKLNLRVLATLSIHDYAITVIDDDDGAKLISERAKFESHLVKTNSVKVVADGTPLSFTSLLLEPYSNKATLGETAIGINAQAQMKLQEFHKAGLQLHIHAHGDGTVHEVLNIIEKFQKDFPRPGLHHHIAHTSMVGSKDVPRFKQLGMVVDFSAPLWFPGGLTNMATAFFGSERMQTKWYPIQQVVDTGAVVGYATDWPLAFPNPSPWPYLEAMVTRKNPYGNAPGRLGAPITLTQAIKIFTLGGAQVMQHDKQAGSIAVGKYADMIVLDRNLFEVPVQNIDSTKVLTTIFEGRTVYEAAVEAARP